MGRVAQVRVTVLDANLGSQPSSTAQFRFAGWECWKSSPSGQREIESEKPTAVGREYSCTQVSSQKALANLGHPSKLFTLVPDPRRVRTPESSSFHWDRREPFCVCHMQWLSP